MSGVLKEKNGVYHAYFYDARLKKPVWRTTGIKAERGNKRKAEQKKNEIIARYFDSPTSQILFTDYIETWLEKAENRVDIVTYEGYKQYAEKHIIPYFKPLRLKLHEVSLSHIEDYYNYKAKAGRLDGKSGGLSYRSIKLHSVVFNLVFKEALRNKLVKENPCTYAELPKNAIKSKKRVDFYTPEECQEVLKLIRGRPLYNMVYITFMYGLRRSELMGLKWSAIDFDANTVKIEHTVVANYTVVAKDKTKNGSSERTYPLLPDIREILLNLKMKQDKNRECMGNCYIDNDYVFTKEDGSTYYPSYPTHEFKKASVRYNFRHIRFHDLRHSCASMLISNEWQMKDISEWLGHSDIGTTMDIYGHLSMEHKRKLGDSLEGVL